MRHLKRVWQSDALRKVLIGVGVVYILVASTVIILQQYQQRIYTENAHANTVAILNEHSKTLAEVASLRQEVTVLAAKLGPALTAGQDALLAQFASVEAKLGWVECTVAATPTQCGPKP